MNGEEEFVTACRNVKNERVSSAKFLAAATYLADSTSFGGAVQMEADDLQAPTGPTAHQNEFIGSLSKTSEGHSLMKKYVAGLKSNNLSVHRACAKLMANLTATCIRCARRSGRSVRNAHRYHGGRSAGLRLSHGHHR